MKGELNMFGMERYSSKKRWGSTATCLLFTTLLLIVFPFQATANAPKEVILSYDAGARTLTVQITHSSSSPGMHYIKKVEIQKDGKSIATHEYKSQPEQATFSYVYPIEAAPGEVLAATVSCSIFGSATEKLTLAK
jgi:hypothetical protein